MTENFVILPSDTSNTGKLVRTNQRVVGGSNVEEHYMILQDRENNFQAQVISGPITTVTGLAVYAIQAGSYNTYNDKPTETEQTRGTFGFSGASFIASGTVSNVITPGLGSKIMLKGFNASAETPSQFRLVFSGGTSTLINTFNLPGSGTVAMNLLGMEPSGAINEPLGIGMFNAGSLNLTLYTKDTL